MTETTKTAAVTAEEIFRDYILTCLTPDDFYRMEEPLWVEILPEIEEFFTDEGRAFTFTESDIPALKIAIDNMFATEFGMEV